MIDVKKIIVNAIQNKEVLLITYETINDGITVREIEPFDMGQGKNDPDGPERLFGWCLFHSRPERKFLEKIKDLKNTGKKFDPSLRPINWNYQVPRDW